ncbi:MAG: cell envelope integrity protein CreD [Sedimentisphaerales bacterium]|nr:cell envelope integrity protein CreD [Sedimentisphaerales bacterium]
MNDFQRNHIVEILRNSHFVKVVLIGFLVLLLQIPIAKIKDVIKEREQTREKAISEVTSKWGKSQLLSGPSIIVPYMNRSYSSRNPEPPNIGYATFLPESLKISGKLDSQLLYRGIYKIPVYTMLLDISGSFEAPDFSEWAIDVNNILWDRAYLSFILTDSWAITKSPTLLWNDRKLNFLPDAGEFGNNRQGVNVKLKDYLDGKEFNFSFSIELNGSVSAFFIPFGRDTEVQLSSNWASPSFQGTCLPANRTVSSEGFAATWNVPFLSRNFPQKWLSSSNSNMDKVIESSGFGVEMISPVDHYTMSQRSVKYQILFLVLTFATLWLIEILAKIRVHPIQYLFIGMGMCMFYLLELSLAEHLGFIQAYSIACAAIVILVTAYSAAVLKARKRAVIVGGVVTLLYIYLYVLLMIEDYALLSGSIGLFVVLSAIMFLTRKVDWYSLTDTVIPKTETSNKE